MAVSQMCKGCEREVGHLRSLGIQGKRVVTMTGQECGSGGEDGDD